MKKNLTEKLIRIWVKNQETSRNRGALKHLIKKCVGNLIPGSIHDSLLNDDQSIGVQIHAFNGDMRYLCQNAGPPTRSDLQNSHQFWPPEHTFGTYVPIRRPACVMS